MCGGRNFPKPKGYVYVYFLVHFILLIGPKERMTGTYFFFIYKMKTRKGFRSPLQSPFVESTFSTYFRLKTIKENPHRSLCSLNFVMLPYWRWEELSFNLFLIGIMNLSNHRETWDWPTDHIRCIHAEANEFEMMLSGKKCSDWAMRFAPCLGNISVKYLAFTWQHPFFIISFVN